MPEDIKDWIHNKLFDQVPINISVIDRDLNVIEANRRVPEGCIGSYICASAAAHELGLNRESRRHYENAELTMCCNCNRFVFCVYLT